MLIALAGLLMATAKESGQPDDPKAGFQQAFDVMAPSFEPAALRVVQFTPIGPYRRLRLTR